MKKCIEIKEKIQLDLNNMPSSVRIVHKNDFCNNYIFKMIPGNSYAISFIDYQGEVTKNEECFVRTNDYIAYQGYLFIGFSIVSFFSSLFSSFAKPIEYVAIASSVGIGTIIGGNIVAGDSFSYFSDEVISYFLNDAMAELSCPISE